MALQTSGAISLNDAHIEVGGTSGTTVALNDADIRGLIGKASGAQFALSELYGASSVVGWIYVMVNPYNGGMATFEDIKINSSGDYFVLLERPPRGANRSGNESNSDIELWKMTDEGVVTTRKGFTRSGISSTYGNDIQVTDANGNNHHLSKLILRGTTDVYYSYNVQSWKIFNQTTYGWSSTKCLQITKHNQSNLDAEDKRWTLGFMNGRPQYNFGNIEAGVGNVTYAGYPSEGNHFVFIDKNNKLVVDHIYQMGSDGALFTARFPFDSSYDQAPEVGVKTRVYNSSQWASWNTAQKVFSWGSSTSQNWRFIENDRKYAVYKDSATRSQSTTSTNYTTQSNNSGISNAHIYRLNPYAYPKFACADGNGYPAVFGYGGGHTSNNTRVNSAIWCQKHTSTGALGNRFSFTPSNQTSSSYNDGGFYYATFDSSDNCYMSGYGQMSQNADGIWDIRGQYSYQKPYSVWIAKFNSSGVYQWHIYLETKEWYEHFQGGGGGFAFQSTYGSSALYNYPKINSLAIDNNGDLVVAGSIAIYRGSNAQTRVPILLKLPPDGQVDTGFVGVTSSINGGTRYCGAYIGRYSGDGQSSSSQFYWANQSTGNIFSNNSNHISNPTVFLVHGKPRHDIANSGTGYSTSSLPCGFNYNGGFHGGCTIGRSQSDSNGNALPYTPPTEYSGTGKEEF